MEVHSQRLITAHSDEDDRDFAESLIGNPALADTDADGLLDGAEDSSG